MTTDKLPEELHRVYTWIEVNRVRGIITLATLGPEQAEVYDFAYEVVNATCTNKKPIYQSQVLELRSWLRTQAMWRVEAPLGNCWAGPRPLEAALLAAKEAKIFGHSPNIHCCALD